MTIQPGKSNKADPLSRQPDHNMGHDDNVDVIVLKEEHFRQHQIQSLDDHIRSVKVNIFNPEEWMADLKDHSHIEDTVLKGLREKDSETRGWFDLLPKLVVCSTYQQVKGKDYLCPS